VLGATEADDMINALQSVQASEFALESSLQVAPPAPAAGQFSSRHGLHVHGQHQQKKGTNSPSLDGSSSCKLINFTSSSPSEEGRPQSLSFPVTFPFEVQGTHKTAAAAPVFFGAHPDHHLGGFVVDSSADVNGGIVGGRSQDSSTRKPSNNGFSTSSGDWETAGRVSFPFDLGADSSEEWRCNIPWESLLTPAAVQAELLPH
jgi:hypothetical protein